MDRPDLREVLTAATKAMEHLDKLLGEAQQVTSHSRFSVTMAVELNGQHTSLDQIIKSQIYTEAMGNVFSRVIEARTHLDVAVRALTEPAKEG